MGSGTKIGDAFGIKDQKFAYKNGISDEKTYLVITLIFILSILVRLAELKLKMLLQSKVTEYLIK